MGIIPDELVQGTSKLINAFNGAVFVSQSDSTVEDDGKAFIIEFDSLSKEACITLATNDWGSGYSSGLIAMQVQGESVANDATSGKSTLSGVMIGENTKAVSGIAMPGATASGQNPIPMPVATAAAACSCDSNNCSISWKYY